jgi:hypothetical protein
VDIRIVAEIDSVFRAIPEIKEELRINVELASPEDFVPIYRYPAVDAASFRRAVDDFLSNA